MPNSAPKPCTMCHTLVSDGTSRCPAHKPAPWVSRPEVKRVRGRQLQSKRAALFAAQPWCAWCLKKGLRVLATIRDHVKPLAEDGSDDDSNIQGLCGACDEVKSKAERERGRGVSISGRFSGETDRSDKVLRAGVQEGGVPFWHRAGGRS